MAELKDCPFQALGTKVIVAVRRGAKKSEGGIILPTEHVEREDRGAVRGFIVNVGMDAWSEFNQTPLTPGAEVTFARYAGRRVDDDDTDDEWDFRVLLDTDIDSVVIGERS